MVFSTKNTKNFWGGGTPFPSGGGGIPHSPTLSAPGGMHLDPFHSKILATPLIALKPS